MSIIVRYLTARRGLCNPAPRSRLCTRILTLNIVQVGKCRGYVTRKSYVAEASRKVSCFLIAQNAENSNSLDRREFKYAHKAVKEELGKTTDKNMFVKMNCGCGTRYVRVARSPDQTTLAILQADEQNKESAIEEL